MSESSNNHEDVPWHQGELVSSGFVCDMLVLCHGRDGSSCPNAGAHGDPTTEGSQTQKCSRAKDAIGSNYMRVRPTISVRNLCPAARKPVATAGGYDSVSAVH